MKITILNSVFAIVIGSIFLFSCVPARRLEEIKAKKVQCETENAQLKTTSQELTTKNTELQSSIETLTKRVTGLCMDTNILGTSQRILTMKNNQLNRTYEDLLRNYDKLNAGNATETQKIMRQLQTTQDSLLNKEDALKRLAAELEAKKITLDKNTKDLQVIKDNLELSKANLEKTKASLEQKEAKLAELQSILNKKDSTVKALKAKVTDALVGYEGKGLSISQKNGKIYVSLDESLLFASGSFTVDPKGVEAIKKLAKVLENNTDINVMIEGHTDNVPYSGTGVIKDNWDLSVMRATAIVKIIVANSNIDPKRLSAAGKSQFDPIDVNTTKEGRAKNRRTEIILTPKLDELFQIIESN